MIYLKADTNTEVLVGPAVAVGDGFTPVTTLHGGSNNLAGADEAELIKYGGGTALTVTDISTNAMTPITGADGYYTLDLSTGNTDTEGFLVLVINDDSLILPIRHEFMVVNANVYDSLFAAAATDYLDVNTFQVGAQTASASGTVTFPNATLASTTNITAGTITTATNLTTNNDKTGYTLSTAGVNAIIDETLTSHVTADSLGVAIKDILADTGELQTDDYPNTLALASVCTETRLSELDAGTGGKMANQVDIIQTDTTTDIPALLPAALVGGRMDSNASAINNNTTAATQLALSAATVESGACEATPSTTVIQTDLAETQDDIYIGRIVIFTSGNARGEATDITDYAGSTGTLTVTALANAPAASDTFVII